MPRLLIVDDDDEICTLIQRFFKRYGYAVDSAGNGDAMDRCLASTHYDLAILDVMLPGEDGLSLCRRLRQTRALPIIMVTGVDAPTDRVIGLEIGADDYVTKPFDAHELLARVRAVLRRSQSFEGAFIATPRPRLHFSGWQLDLARRELRSADNTLTPLSAGEFELLLAFAEHARRVLTRDELMNIAHGPLHDAFDRSIDVQVSRLRRKIEVDATHPHIIRTVRNGGYVFDVSVERSS
ncbi:response regulator [Salinisphaera sp. Q1T1-3]|uniref:response regulator n=1 Tax=Salinisphaera sp. Q1T1-3 TaxID=2321229 RepID=UPI000E7350FD|nr:response regulator [Salinisphaera sp. Q1T1-3]RJS93565.1 response regulator [Salinisphaera sp. Q1T1-3]